MKFVIAVLTGIQNKKFLSLLCALDTLDPDIRISLTGGALKKKLTSLIRPPEKSVFGIHVPKDLSIFTQLPVGFNKLNLYKFRQNFKDTIDPQCSIKDGIEDTFYSNSM